jgi:hypothetical protein
MPKPMSRTEYRRTLKQLGLSNRGFCLRILGVDETSGRRWKSGRRSEGVPPSVAAFLRLAVAVEWTAEQLYALGED